jgi:mannose-6-phosphate isomerase-like protein (cupin superfamily)
MAMEFFDGSEMAPILDVMSVPTYPDGVLEEFGSRMKVLSEVSETTVAFVQDDPDGVSLVHYWLAPGRLLPSHSHNADCLYYVLEGEAVMGKRSIGPGAGFFVPAGTTYTYRAGPAGVKLLEFRTKTSFDMQITDHLRSRWEDILAPAS